MKQKVILLPLTGTIINSVAIILGALIGTYIVRNVPSALQKTIMEAIALGTILIGLRTAWGGGDVVVLIISLALGALLGELLDLDGALNKFAAALAGRFQAESGTFAKGFITATLVYAVGAMAIMGALENGITGRHDILLAKSALDGITSVVFGSAFGLGVAFSAAPVFVYQGSIALLASTMQPILSDSVIAQMSAVGGLLILAIGLNLLGAAKIKIANLLPGIPVAMIITILVNALR